LDNKNLGYSPRNNTPDKLANAIEQTSPYSTVRQPTAQSRVKCQGRASQ